jgi:hypothetical protein
MSPSNLGFRFDLGKHRRNERFAHASVGSRVCLRCPRDASRETPAY